MKIFGVTLSKVMGMNLWFAPQISEHCPKNNPGRVDRKLVWLRRPGVASTFTPKLGTVQEWRTSAAEIKMRIWEFIGITMRESTSKRRVIFILRSLEGIKKESNSIFKKSEYS